MRYLVRTTTNLLNMPRLLIPSYTQTRLMSTSPVKPPQYELDAKAYRQRIAKNYYDTNAIYGLAVCINLGASIHPSDLVSTQRMAVWLNKKITSKITALDVQASLYRQILRFNSIHASAIWALAQCLRQGASPQPEDLRYTWLEGGNFITEDGPGLTKPVILLLAQALEQRSKEIEISSRNTKKSKKSI